MKDDKAYLFGLGVITVALFVALLLSIQCLVASCNPTEPGLPAEVAK